MEIGRKIAQIRKEAGLTQVEFARRVGVGIRFVRDVEQGKKSIRLDKLNQALDFLGYHVEAIKNEREFEQ